MRALELVGKRFGRLTVVSRGPNDDGGRAQWNCVCECGVAKMVRGNLLQQGFVGSCGCWHRENRQKFGGHTATHNKHGSKEWNAWQSVRRRCYDPGYANYDRYGAVGVQVADRWRNSFENFLADMGPAPSLAHSVDRINGKGNYEPGNCRWATAIEQANNRSSNFLIHFQGRTQTSTEWGRELGLSPEMLRRRITSGWDVELAFTKPPRVVNRRASQPEATQ